MNRINKRPKPPPVEALAASNLPCEIIHHILLRLPAKSLLKFKSVSKSWKKVISDPQFIQSHHNHSKSSIDRTRIFYQPKNVEACFAILYSDNHETHFDQLYFPRQYKSYIVCSCEGLVLLADRSRKFLYLWNPSIRKYTMILCPVKHTFPFPPYGFCYDSSSDDYKVVLIDKDCSYVFSLRKDSWGKGPALPYSGISITPTVFVNGALHWVVTKKQGNARSNGIGFYTWLHEGGHNYFDRPWGTLGKEAFEYDATNTHDIISFNPKDEKYTILPRPELIDGHCVFYLMALWGCLGLYNYSYDRRRMRIWLRMGNEFDHPSSWEKMINISDMPIQSLAHIIQPLCCISENELLIHSDLGRFILYNVEEDKFVKMDCVPYDSSMVAVPFVDSLLLPGVTDKPKRRWFKTEKRITLKTGTSGTSDVSTANGKGFIFS